MQELLDRTDIASTKRNITFGFDKFESFLRLKQQEFRGLEADRPWLDGVLREFYSS